MFKLQTSFKPLLQLVCNVNIVYGNLKSENSQDYAQKPQQVHEFGFSISMEGLRVVSQTTKV